MRAAYAQIINGDAAERPWFTLVHGASQNRHLFSAQITRFAPHYRLLLVDLPGHGRSAHVRGPYGPAEYAEAVAAAMRGAGVAASHYWGTHTGAGVGLLLALRSTPRLRSLVLEAPVLPGVELPSVSNWVGRARSLALTHGVAVARDDWFRRAGWFRVIRAHPRRCRAAAHRAIIDAFGGAPWLDATSTQRIPALRQRLRRIDCPVLVLNGEHDLPDFVAVADELADSLVNCQRLRIAGAGGFPLWEFPDAVNAGVETFLAAGASTP